jgi:acyl carrier protein
VADIASRTRKIVTEVLDADPAKVTDDARFIEDLGADSLDAVELLMSIEEEFDVEIPDAVGYAADTVGKAIAELTKLVEG